MHKVLISVAPVSAADTHPDPAVIAADVIQSAREGAGQVHLHVRDLHGALTPDLTVFKETVEPIAAASDIVIQASTGGVSRLTIEERCAPLYYDRARNLLPQCWFCQSGRGCLYQPDSGCALLCTASHSSAYPSGD